MLFYYLNISYFDRWAMHIENIDTYMCDLFAKGLISRSKWISNLITER